MAPIKPNMLQEIYSKFYSILKCSLCAYIYEKYVLVNYAYHRKILVIIKLIKNQKFSFNSIVLLLTIYSDFKIVLQNNNTRGSFLCYPTHLISAENDNRLIGCLIHVCVFSIYWLYQPLLLDQAMLVQHSETNYSYCFYHMDKASQLGCFSIILLISGQVIVMLGSSCFVGRNLSPGCSKAWAFVWFIASWWDISFSISLEINIT